MKVLFIAEDCPYPPDNGGRLRTFNLLKYLSLRHEITLIAPMSSRVEPESGFGHPLKLVIPVSPPRWNSLHKINSLTSPLPWSVHKHYSSTMRTAVLDAIRTDRFDLLHCDSTLVAPAVPPNLSLPKVLNAHNVESVIWERYLAAEHRPWLKPLLRSQLTKVSAYESQLLRYFDCCVTVSEQDLKELTLRYGYRNARVVPNGVDLGFYAPQPESHTSTIAFIGSLDYRPNKAAICWFVESIWPRIQTEAPEVEMLLVGRRPPRWLEKLCKRASIRLCPNVPDVRPYLASAALTVVPIRIGGGTRLKILESMAASRCVVSTKVGAEGLEVQHGEHLIIADDPTKFALAVISLLRDPVQRRIIAGKGQALVEAKYGWDKAALQMEEIWSQMLAGRQGLSNDGV